MLKSLNLCQVSIYCGANNVKILDAGLWILDEIRNVFSLSPLKTGSSTSIKHPATSIASTQVVRYLLPQPVGLRRSFASSQDEHTADKRARSLPYQSGLLQLADGPLSSEAAG